MKKNKDQMLSMLANALFKDANAAPVSQELRQKIAKIVFDNHEAFFTDCINGGNIDAIPYFQLVNATTLEGGQIFKCVDDSKSHPIYQVAAGASKASIKEALEEIIYGNQAQHTTANPKTFSDVFDAGLNRDGTGFHGSRSPISYGEKISRISGKKRNGLEDYNYAKQLYEAPEGSPEKELWHFFQELVLKDENDIPPCDFLRQLRLLKGTKTQYMGIAVGHKDVTGSAWSRVETGRLALTAHHAHKIIDENLFDLPVDEKTGKVRSDVRNKFLQKFGYQTGTAEQLAAVIKSMAIEHMRHLAHGGAEHDSCIFAMMERNSTDKKGCYRSHLLAELMHYRVSIEELRNQTSNRISVPAVRDARPDLALPQNADYLHLLPTPIKNDHFYRQSTELHAALAKSLAFEIAEHAPTLSSFFARYQRINVKTIKAIGDNLGLGQSRISQILNESDSLSENNTKRGEHRNKLINSIIETNAFDLPTGADGKILPDLVEAIWTLHRKEKYTSPYLDVLEAAKQALIPLPHDTTTWVARTADDAAKEFNAWQHYWRKISAKFEHNGEVNINGEPVRCFINADGHLLIHKSDIRLLEESKDFAKLLEREDRKAASR